MKFEHFVANRYLKPRRDNLYVTLIGGISVVGVTVGVMAIVLVLSILNGFEREIKSRFIGFDSHIKIMKPHDEGITHWDEVVEKIRSEKSVVGVSPYVLQKAMITSSSGNHVTFVKGTTEETIVQVTTLEKSILHGKVDFSKQDSAFNGMLVGYSLSLQLDVNAQDTLTVISPAGVTSPFSMPIAKRFSASGVFKTDMYEYDNAYVFVGLSDAQDLFEMEDQITGIDVKLDHIDKSFDVRDRLAATLGEKYVVETWFDQHSDLYSAMKIEKWGSLVVLSLIILVAGFNIVSTLIMVVMQKTAEIGILKSMGASSNVVSGIFMRQGLIIGSIGILMGCLLGYGICVIQMQFSIIKMPQDIFFLDALPVELKWVDFFAIVIVAFCLCLFSTVYPARKAAKLLPVEALRS
ncbi:FtsX-like permease family protein [bacterium]|nr:MAG: FtsX-like permease family protein [bacterium]